jgi:hypothetical protein
VYVPEASACSVPNSANVPTQAQVNAANQNLMNYNNIVQKALSTFVSVLNRPDLNKNGLPLKSNGGVPSAPFTGFRAWPDWSQGNPAGATPACLTSVPTPSSIPTNTRDAVAAPKAPPMVPQTIEGRAVVSTGKPPTTGNVCMDLQKGYAIQSQVSALQLWKCSKAGYSQMGLKPTLPAVLALQTAGTLPKIPDQDVPNYDAASMGMAGMAGMADATGLLSLLAWSVGGFLLWNVWKAAR